MRRILTLLAFVLLIIIPLSTNVHAQTSYDVKIPTGAADPNAPYFWQSVKDGSTSGVVEILIGDTICLVLVNHILTSLLRQVIIHIFV
jgi:hypothetical protein